MRGGTVVVLVASVGGRFSQFCVRFVSVGPVRGSTELNEQGDKHGTPKTNTKPPTQKKNSQQMVLRWLIQPATHTTPISRQTDGVVTEGTELQRETEQAKTTQTNCTGSRRDGGAALTDLVEAPAGQLRIQSASGSKDAGYLAQTPAEKRRGVTATPERERYIRTDIHKASTPKYVCRCGV